MRELIRKEWRENRALILGFLAVAPLLSAGLKWFVVTWEKVRPEDTADFMAPGLTGLFVLAVACDLVAGDAGSGRIGFLAALPVRPARIWVAKVLFLLLSSLLFLGYVLGAEAAILALGGIDPAGILDAMPRMTLPMIYVATIGAATLFYSTLIDRGFAAAGAALVTLAGAYVLYGALGGKAVGVPWCAMALSTGFLLGSLAAFAGGRIHLGSRLRRIALAVVTFVVVVGAPAAGAAVSLDRWRTLRPEEENLRIRVFDTSPGGEWTFVFAERREREGPFGVIAPHALWAVRLADGTVRDLTPHGYLTGREDSFGEGPDRVVLLRNEPVPGEKTPNHLRVVYDLEAGEVVSTRPHRRGPLVFRHDGLRWDVRGGTHVLREDGTTLALPKDHILWGAVAAWGAGVIHVGHRQKYGVIDFATGEVAPVLGPTWLLSPEPGGRALVHRREGLFLQAPGGEPEKVLAGDVRQFAGAPDGRHGVFLADGAVWLARASDGSLTRLEGPEVEDHFAPMIWATDARRFLVMALDGPWLGELDEDGEVSLRRLDLPYLGDDPVWFGGDTLLVLDSLDASELDVVTLDGKVRRLLPAREGGAR